MIRRAAGLPARERVTKFVKKHNGKKREIFVQGKDLRMIIVQTLGKLIRRDDEPGKVQVDLDAAEFEEPNRALHTDFNATAEQTPARVVLQSHLGGRVRGHE